MTLRETIENLGYKLTTFLSIVDIREGNKTVFSGTCSEVWSWLRETNQID